MPEGPECHTIGNSLNRILSGSRLLHFQVHGGRYQKHGNPTGWEDMVQDLLTRPVMVSNVEVKGKLICWNFSNNMHMLNTLGMSGTWRKNESKHCDFSIIFQKEGKRIKLWFKDQRHFGTIKFVYRSEYEQKLSQIGPDVLTDEFTKEHWFGLCRKYPKWTLPKLLMYQKNLSGIGNYLKCEILYKARVSPHREMESLTIEEKDDLYKFIRLIPHMSLKRNGVSLRDYAAPDGSEGEYQFALQVYSKAKDPEDHKVVREVTNDKRTTHWVPNVQK